MLLGGPNQGQTITLPDQKQAVLHHGGLIG